METRELIGRRYRLVELIGTGGMAEVWSAVNVMTDRSVAVKFLKREAAATEEARVRFLQEARASARIRHPHVIDVLDVGETEDGQLFLVMELLTGASLEAVIRRRSIPITLVGFLEAMRDVARALSQAHASGVLHRDLKPSNIFLHRDAEQGWVAKVLDFGVSKFLTTATEPDQGLTAAGAVLGSPLYMSPEQARGETNLDGRTDIFSFGTILFEAITAMRPFDSPNFNALIVNIATKPAKNIDEFAPHLPVSLRGFVARCLANEREARPASFEEVIFHLNSIIPELESSDFALPIPGEASPDHTNALAALVGHAAQLREPERDPEEETATAVGTWRTLSPPNGRQKRGAWIAVTVGIAAVAAGAAVALGMSRSHVTQPAPMLLPRTPIEVASPAFVRPEAQGIPLESLPMVPRRPADGGSATPSAPSR